MKKIFLLLLIYTGAFLSAQVENPPNPGGGGGDGFGVQTSPIDGDLWILAAVCIIFIAVFAIRYRRMSATN